MSEFFAYIRVSTAKQGIKGVSLQEQRDAINRYAQTHNLIITEWFEERESAAKRGRAAFGKMLEILKSGDAKGVIIHKIDRSARNLKDWADLGELIDVGIKVHFITDNFDMTSRGGRLSADIQAVVAADYIRNLREEAKKGLYGRLKQGLYPWRAPIGYLDRGGGQPKVPDPERAHLVRHAFELYGRAIFDLKRLRKELYGLGFRNKSGSPVSLNGLNGMLRNPFYMGIVRAGPERQLYKGIHEPLVSVALFQRVQAILDGKISARTIKHDLLFRRLLTCHHCGHSLVGERQKAFIYYRCHTKECPTTAVREDRVETYVREQLAPMELNDEEYGALRDALSEIADNAATRNTELLKGLQLGKERTAERLNRLTDAYLDQLIDKEAFETRREALLLDNRRIEEKIAILQQAPTAAHEDVASFLEQARSLRNTYEMALQCEKRAFLRDATSNRIVSGKHVAIQWSEAYVALVNRPKLDLCEDYRDRPRTFIEFVEYLLSVLASQRSPMSPNS